MADEEPTETLMYAPGEVPTSELVGRHAVLGATINPKNVRAGPNALEGRADVMEVVANTNQVMGNRQSGVPTDEDCGTSVEPTSSTLSRFRYGVP